MNKMDITPILELVIKLIVAIVTIYLIPKIKKLIATKVSETDQKKIIRWAEIAAQAAEEAARSGLIIKSEKFGYAKAFLEARGITFDDATMKALINSAVWDLFNQFKDDESTHSSPESEA